MIGPHEGQELELILQGKKYLAAFGDIVPENGTISEDIIPEQLFAPHVQSSQIKRFQKQIYSQKKNHTIQYVCFTLPEHEWRTECYFWIRELIHSNQIPYDHSCDIFIGRLLGYSEADIQSFLK